MALLHRLALALHPSWLLGVVRPSTICYVPSLGREALRGHDVRDVLIREFLEDGGLAGVVEAEHEDTGLLVRPLQLAQQRKETHGSGGG